MNNVGCAAPGYAPFNYPPQAAIAGAYPSVGNAPYGYNPYAMQGPMGYAGMSLIGADPAPAPATPGLMDKVKTYANQETFGIKNEYLGLGAVAIGGIWYAYSKGVFGKKGR